MSEETDCRCSDSEGEADLQGAVAAVEVIQARRVDELLVHSAQRLHRGQKTPDMLIYRRTDGTYLSDRKSAVDVQTHRGLSVGQTELKVQQSFRLDAEL